MNLTTEIQGWDDYPEPPEFGHDDLDDIVAYERAEERGSFARETREAVAVVARQYVTNADEIEPDVPADEPWDNREQEADAAIADTWRAAALELLAAFGIEETAPSRPACRECGETIDTADPRAGYGMCASCLHDALRSGWTPTDEED